LAAALFFEGPIPLGERLAKLLGLKLGDFRLPGIGPDLVFNGSMLLVGLLALKLELAGLDPE
jgi:hypothetical protein